MRPADPQTSNTVLMVRPARFGFNPETAVSNAFAQSPESREVAAAAVREFDGLVERLDAAGVEILILPDAPEASPPDSVFPNNWVSFHADGTVVLYPMAAPTRRQERRMDLLHSMLLTAGFGIQRTVDLSPHEDEGRFLEGTGSLILDRPKRRAFASRSIRTDEAVVAAFDAELGYSTTLFDAADRSGGAIYHTNVLLSLGRRFAALCFDAVPEEQRPSLVAELEETGRKVVPITYEQMCSFACNILEIGTSRGDNVIAMSGAARRSLDPGQVRRLEELGGEIVGADIPTIEAVGGGSVRCMIADIHLPRAGVTRGS